MGAFVSLLPQPPRENPAQAYSAGQESALKAQAYNTENQVRQEQMAEMAQQTENMRQQGEAQRLANEQAQAMAAGRTTLNQALPDYVKQGPGGMPVVDYSGLMGDPRMQGHGLLVPNLIKENYDQVQQGYKVAQEKAGRVASILGSINDDDSKTSGVNQALGEGLIDQDTAQRYLTTPYDQLKSEFGQHQRAAQSAEQQIGFSQKVNEFEKNYALNAPKTDEQWMTASGTLMGGVYDQESLDRTTGALKQAGAPDWLIKQVPQYYDDRAAETLRTWGIPLAQQPKFEQGDLEFVAQSLQGAAVQSKEAYAAAYNAVSPSLRPLLQFFPKPEEYDPKNTPDAVMTTGSQSVQALNAKMMGVYRNAMLGIRQENADTARAREGVYADRYNNPQQSPAAVSRDISQARGDFGKWTLEEGKLNRELATIQGQMANGATTDSRTGTTQGGSLADLKSQTEQQLAKIRELKQDALKRMNAGSGGRAASGPPNAQAPMRITNDQTGEVMELRNGQWVSISPPKIR